MQIELDFPTATPHKLLKDIPHGTAFRLVRPPKLAEALIKVKPVNFLCNSTILSDVFARGDCVVVNLAKGTVYISKGTTEIVLVDASVKIKNILGAL